jgi:hypothetical protein
MNYTLAQIFGFSIAFPAIVGLVRYPKIKQVYFPFILLLWIGLANEILSIIIVKQGNSNAINNNIYVLLESIFLLLLFRNFGVFSRSKKVFWIILILFTGFWIAENFFISRITWFSSYFRIFYSFTVVLLSVNKVNHLMVEEKQWNERRALFILLIGFIVFFIYKSFVEIFWLYGLYSSKKFGVEVYRIMTYINLAVNLIFGIALLWIPRKRESLLR